MSIIYGMKQLDYIIENGEFIEQIKRRLEAYEEMKKVLFTRLAAAPEGQLIIRHGYYYMIKNEQVLYLSVQEKELIKKLAQKAYDEWVLKRINRESTCLRILLDMNSKRPISWYYNHLQEKRRLLIEPVLLDDDSFCSEWSSLPYQRFKFSSHDSTHFVFHNIRMRSKSELIIAGILRDEGILFRYEYPLEIESAPEKQQFRPDFFCVDPQSRREFIWEHFGKMDDLEYRKRAEEKMLAYSFSPIMLKHPFLTTFEDIDTPLDTEEIAKRVKIFLKNLRSIQ